MREFYVYGFKTREEYTKKSARSYDDERRRIESILGDYMHFVRTPEGKSVFISIDSRHSRHNPFYKAWKSKSFTDGDITLHFILFDILHRPEEAFTLNELLDKIEGDYLSHFDEPMQFDESTVRKKLKEYVREGIVLAEKRGKRVYYRRRACELPDGASELLDFFSEVLPCGVIGSYLLDKIQTEEGRESLFDFKHHYITPSLDSDILACLFDAMQKKSVVTVANLNRSADEPRRVRLIPLRIFISVQTGRQHLLAYAPDVACVRSYRVDYLKSVTLEEPTPRFDELRAELDSMMQKIWGVNTKRNRFGKEHIEHAEFTVRIAEGEEHIIRRLEREKRVGRVEKLDDYTYRFVADVYDSGEMTPWVRSFICRIVDIRFSNRTVENRFKDDLRAMYRMYGLQKEDV
ncbi:MAG: WYL domain-containing protein [Clostridia bacterium]|nr:WYL domain-containing protein [Clostridia bacterium]